MPPAELPPLGSETARPPQSAGSVLRRAGVWLRFHVSSLVAAAVDFGTMIVVVQALRQSPVLGTVAGAFLGAITNFLLGRFWTYRRGDAPIGRQAFRYALVSGGSLGLNALGEYLLAVRLGVSYVLARVVVAVIVSNAWNFPLQSLVVFRRPGSAPPSEPPS